MRETSDEITRKLSEDFCPIYQQKGRKQDARRGKVMSTSSLYVSCQNEKKKILNEIIHHEEIVYLSSYFPSFSPLFCRKRQDDTRREIYSQLKRRYY